MKAKHAHAEKLKQREKERGKNVKGGKAGSKKRSFRQSLKGRGAAGKWRLES